MIGPSAARAVSLTPLLANGANVRRDSVAEAWRPLGGEPAPVAEEAPPGPVRHDHLDPEPLGSVVEPLVHVRHAGEQERKAEPDRPLVEALRAGAQAEPTTLVHREVDVHRQMLVRPEVVDDAAPTFSVDHGGVEATGPSRELERPHPGH